MSKRIDFNPTVFAERYYTETVEAFASACDCSISTIRRRRKDYGLGVKPGGRPRISERELKRREVKEKPRPGRKCQRCDRPYYARGLCYNHYHVWYYHARIKLKGMNKDTKGND